MKNRRKAELHKQRKCYTTMSFDFTTMLSREGQDAIAVEKIPIPGAEIDPSFSRIPMWVADMNFITAPSITEAIVARAQHPAFGYFTPRPEYYDAILNWQRTRNGVQGLEAKHIGYENGVLGGVATALRVLCSAGDAVLLHSPTYIGFTHVLENYGYRIVLSPLVQDADGVWRMDYEDMDRKLKEKELKALLARDEELISMLIQLEKDFWRHVQENIPLPMDGSQAAASLLTQKFPDSKPKSHITLPEGAMELIERYDQACEQLDIITQQKREAENRLKEMIGEHEIGTVGNRIVTWKSISQERLDSKTLKAEHPVLYQKYTNRTSYRRFSIKATV